jgi:hypothetical protein
MAHYAIINPTTNTVTQVFVGKNENEGDLNWEQYYAPVGTICRRTSYNTHGGVHSDGGTPFRKNYAGVGYTWDEQRDAFIPPKPYPSWALNEQTCIWDPPTPMPGDGNPYVWDEESQQWLPVSNEVT